MSKSKYNKSLNWAEFQSLGDPSNVNETLGKEEEKGSTMGSKSDDKVRVYKEKKGRGGKSVTLIKGLSLATPQLEEMCKQLKTKCGVGGKVEGRQIMIQGDQRDKVISLLLDFGYSDVKNAGH